MGGIFNISRNASKGDGRIASDRRCHPFAFEDLDDDLIQRWAGLEYLNCGADRIRAIKSLVKSKISDDMKGQI